MEGDRYSSSSVVTGLKEMSLRISSGIRADMRQSFLEMKFALSYGRMQKSPSWNGLGHSR
jgi:hypothetical protein